MFLEELGNLIHLYLTHTSKICTFIHSSPEGNFRTNCTYSDLRPKDKLLGLGPYWKSKTLRRVSPSCLTVKNGGGRTKMMREWSGGGYFKLSFLYLSFIQNLCIHFLLNHNPDSQKSDRWKNDSWRPAPVLKEPDLEKRLLRVICSEGFCTSYDNWNKGPEHRRFRLISQG